MTTDARLVDWQRMYSWFDDRTDVLSMWAVDSGFVAEIGGIALWDENQNAAGSMAWTCWLAQ